MSEKILLVDDDPNVLNGFRRHLRRKYDLTLAAGGDQAIEALEQEGPFAVIVSDMQMPGMNGVELLSKVAEINRDTVRMMLTGNADQDTAVAAVNESRIFRFLNKPCAPEALAQALDAGLEQYRLITAERELLSQTLSRSVGLLTDVLSLVNSTAFGRAGRAKRLAHEVCQRLNIDETWQIEIAAMLSQVGCVTVPEATLANFFAGRDLNPADAKMLDEHPRIGHELVAKIPRLEGVAEIIVRQNLTHKAWDDEAADLQERYRQPASILKVVLDYELITVRSSQFDAMESIKTAEEGTYDPEITRALIEVVEANSVVQEVTLLELEEGMLIEEPIRAQAGEVLVAGQHEVTSSLLARLRHFAKLRGIEEPIRIRCVKQESAVDKPDPTKQPMIS